MGELKKYDGGVMFSDNDVCDVESLKVRFTPIQSGTGTPSPTNVMPISGYNRFNVKHTGKNVCRLDGWGAKNTNNYGDAGTTNSYGTTISTADPSEPVVITQSQAPDSSSINTYQNGYFVIVSDSLEFDKYYNVSFDVTNITNNPLNIAINSIALVSPSGGSFSCSLVNENRIMFKNYQHKQKSSSPTLKINQIEVRICGLSCTISNVLITKVVDENADYEAFNGKEFVIDSPVSGKNLCDIYGIGATNFMSIYAEPSDTNSYGTSIVVSENNNKVVITQSQAPNTSQPWYYQNGYISLGVLGLTFEKTYKVSFRVTNIVNNPLNTTLSDIKVYPPSGSGGAYNATIYDTDRVLFTIPYNMFQSKPYRNYFEIRNCGMSCTLSDFMVTEADVEDQTYEPYKKTMYGGYIDFVKGEYVQEWACETDNGGTWYLTQEGNAYQWGHSKCSNAVADIISTHWKTTKVNTNENKVFMNPNGALYIGREFWNAADITPTAESVAAYFQTQKEAGTPLYCCCKLLNPIHHPLTPLQLQTYAGINNIWCEANGEADIWRRSSKPISTEVDKSVTGDTYGIANFETKSALPLEKCKVGFEFSQDLNGYSKPWAGGAGNNMWDEKWEVGTISTTTGENNSSASTRIRSKNYIKVKPNESYYFYSNGKPAEWFEYDENKNFLRYVSGDIHNTVFTVSADCYYRRFVMYSGYGNTYNNDIAVNYPSSVTTYTPYANVCPINGTSEFNVVHTGKNLAHIVGYSASSIQRPYSARYLSNSYGTTINTIDYLGKDGAVVITQSQAPKDSYPSSYQNGYFEVIPDNLVFGKSYCVSFKISEIISNPLNVDLSSIKIGAPNGSVIGGSVYTNENKIRFIIDYKQSTNKPNMTDISIYNCGMSFTLSEFMVTPVDDEDVTFEPYSGETISVKLPALGKNLLNPENPTLYYLSQDGEYFTNTDVDTRDGVQISVQAFESLDSTLIEQFGASSVITNTGTCSITFTPSNTACEKMNYIRIKHNGLTKDLCVNLPMKLAYGKTYTFSCDITGTDVGTVGGFTFGKFQIEDGSTATSYEPFNNTVYSGYLDMSSGELTLDWMGATRRLSDASRIVVGENWDRYAFEYIFQTTIPNQYTTQLCSIVPYQWEMVSDISHFFLSNSNNKSILYIFLPHGFDTDTEFTVVGKPYTPITYQLTPQQITAFRGMNNIYQTASNSIEIDYKDMNHNELDLIGLRRGVLLNVPHVETIKSLGNVNFTSDMIAPLNECAIDIRPIQECNGYDHPWVGGSGKNLYDVNTYPLTDGMWINGGDGTKSSNSEFACTQSFIPCDKLQGKTLTLNKRPGGGHPGIAFYSTNSYDSYVSGVENNSATPNTPMTFEVPSTANYMGFTVPSGATDIQIEEGSVSTSFAPYENICPISDMGELNIVHCGKNLLNAVAENEVKYYYSSYDNYTLSDGVITTSGAIYMGFKTMCSPCTQYTFSLTSTYIGNALHLRVWCFDSEPTVLPNSTNFLVNETNISQTTFITDENAKWIVVGVYMGNSIGSQGIVLSNFQVELGDTATTYEKYSGDIVSVAFPPTEKNIAHIVSYSAETLSNSNGVPKVSNSYGTTISTTSYSLPDTPVTITQTSYGYEYLSHYRNGFFTVQIDNLEFGKKYNISLKIDIINNPMNATLSDIRLSNPNGNTSTGTYSVVGNKIIIKNYLHTQYSVEPNRHGITIYCCGMSFTMSEFMVTNTDVDTERMIDFSPYTNNIYYGSLNLKTGELIKEWSGREITGNEYWYVESPYENSNRTMVYVDFSDKGGSTSVPRQIISDKIASTTSQYPPEEYKGCVNSNGVFMIGLPIEYDTVDKVNNWIKSIGGFTVISPLYTPVHYQLTPQQIKSIVGKNSITTNSIGDVNVKYWRHNSPSSKYRSVNFNQWCLPLNDENWVRVNSNYTDVYYSYDTANIIWKQAISSYNTSIKLRNYISFTKDDIWYVSYMLKPSVQTAWSVEVNNNVGNEKTIPAGVWSRYSTRYIMTRSESANIYLPNARTATADINILLGANCEVKAPILINLTQMFGAGNEPTVDEFESQCALNGINLFEFQDTNTEGKTINWYY